MQVTGTGGWCSLSGMIAVVLVRFVHLAVSRVFAALWLSRMTDREKDVETLFTQAGKQAAAASRKSMRPPLP